MVQDFGLSEATDGSADTLDGMAASEDDFYRQIRQKIHALVETKGSSVKYAEILLAGPDLLHLMCRLALDARVPAASKALLATAIAYFISPVDLIPEALVGPTGYLDDIALAAVALNHLISAGSGAIAKEHWAGTGDVLELVQRIVAVADKMVGAQAWSKLKRMMP
jgi:uncharacterized membrane protein YkvA (DUF1232 family)